MTPSSDEIFAKMSELLTPFNKNGIELKPDTEIMAELSIDSVAVMDFVMEIEDHFDIDIPLNVLGDAHTMADMVKVVEARVR